MIWATLFHAYQPPGWKKAVLKKVTAECYRPFFTWLDQHPKVHVTINLSASLSEQLDAINAHDILPRIAKLAARDQIELVGSAMYHPILPLLPDEIVRRQIEENTERNRELLDSDFTPRGFFPPEMAYAPSLGRSIREAGFAWAMLDELAHHGSLGDVAFDVNYQDASTPLQYIFRNRVLSDYLFFSANLDDPSDFWRAVEQDGRSREALPMAMDLENLGHHRPGLDRYWQTLVNDPRVTTMTISELIQHQATRKRIRLSPVAASWATRSVDLAENAPYPLWKHPDNPIHQLQWQLTNLVIEEVGSAVMHCTRKLQLAFDRTLASDQYWWASATPWWDVSIIQRGADALVAVVEQHGGSEAACTRAHELRSSIFALAHDWHEHGVAEQRRRAFFQSGEKRRLGGSLLTQ